MRVAYICADPGVPVFGPKGSSIHVQGIVRAFLRAGAQVDLYASSLSGKPPTDLAAVPVHPLPALPRAPLALRESQAVRNNQVLRLMFKDSGPFDLVYERYSLWSFAAIELAQEQRIPGIVEVNAPLIDEQALHRGLNDRQGAEAVAGRLFAAASVIVAVSEEVGSHVSRYPQARGKVVVLPNGVDPERFPLDQKATLPKDPGSFTIGFVGTMKPWHGLDLLEEAFFGFKKKDPAARLLLVGDGPEREAFAERIGRRGAAGAVHFTGAVDPSEVPGLLASMDLGAAPYPPHDNFYFSPLKVYEYMAAGLPVVASAVGQLRDLIEDGRTGLLCPPGDPAAFAQAFERLRNSPPLAAALGQEARSTVLREHTWDQVVQDILRAAGLPRHRSLSAVAGKG